MKVRRLYLGTLLSLTVAISMIYPTVAFPAQYHLLSIGSVELKRGNWLWYRRINAPESLNPNDLIRVTQRNSAKIRCSDWKERVIPTGSTRVSDICPSVNRPRLRYGGSNIIAPRGGRDLLIPFLITPRRTAILDDQPLLSWNAVPNATRYTVRLHGESGIIWETEVSRNQVIYPGEPPLEQGEKYSIVVEANTGTSSSAEGIPKLGFSLLEEDEAQEVKDAARKLAEAELPDETKALELAHLYRSYNLMAEAIEVLEPLVDQGKSTTAIYDLLGECYWQIGLTLHTRDAYSQVVELAVEPEDIEDKAKAQRALGEIYITLKQFEQAVSLLKDARMAYVELEGYNSEKVREIDGRLAELDLSVKTHGEQLIEFETVESRIIRTDNQSEGISRRILHTQRSIQLEGISKISINEVNTNNQLEGISGSRISRNNEGITRNSVGEVESLDRQQNSPQRNSTTPNRHLYELEQQADIYYREGQFEQALEILQQLLIVFKENNDSSSQAIILKKIGEVEVRLGKYYKALDSYQQALEMYRETGDRLGEASILISMAELYSQHNLYIAINEYTIIGSSTLLGGTLEGISIDSEKIDREIINVHPVIIHVNPVNTTINTNNEYLGASQFCTLALCMGTETLTTSLLLVMLFPKWDAPEYFGEGVTVISATIGEPKLIDTLQKNLVFYQQALDIYQQINEPVKAATTLNSMGVIYMEQGDYSQALESYQKGLAILREHQERTQEGLILNNIGEVYRKSSQYAKALDYYEQALKALELTNELAGTAATFNNIGIVHQELGSISSALNYYQNALAIHREINNRPDEAKTLNNLGLAYQQLDQNEQALEYYQKALTIRRERGDRAGEATTLNNLGLLHNKLNNHSQALKLLEQALSTFQELDKRADVGNTLDSIGTVYKSMGEYSQALKFYLQALEIVQEFGNRTLEGIVLTNIGEVYELQGKNSQAISFYQQAIDQVIETILVDLKGETLKSSFADKHVDTYTRLINLLWDEGRFTEAFNYVERTKARLFLNQIANGTVNLRDGAEADLLQQEQQLRTDINRLNHQLQKISHFPLNQNNTRVIATLQSELTTHEQNYIKLLDRLKRQNPEVADLVSVNPAQLAEIQRLLDTDTTLVEYFVTDTRTLAFVITRDTLTPVTLNVSKQALQEAIQRFYEYDFATLSSQHPQSLTQLHQWLIAPLQPHISTPKVSLVPHNLLHYLPFAALSDGKDYLIDNHTLFNLPNASMLRFLQDKRKPESGELMALGNPTLDLPFAKQEVETISNLYATQPLLGRQATERAIWSQANQSGILHLATHGEYNPQSPLFSTLRLAPDNSYDGRLEVHEIYQLDLREATNLVVLSACQTQVGQLSKGDELIGLNRAFLYAGTPSVIATLWNVDDPATGFLMERFYTYLRQGKSKAQALQQAQKDTRIKHPHPYYWAAFVLTGDGGTMP